MVYFSKAGWSCAVQEFDGAIKIVKINADPSPILVEKYKVALVTSSLHHAMHVKSFPLSIPFPIRISRCGISSIFQ
jgi:hypothetical protein